MSSSFGGWCDIVLICWCDHHFYTSWYPPSSHLISSNINSLPFLSLQIPSVHATPNMAATFTNSDSLLTECMPQLSSLFSSSINYDSNVVSVYTLGCFKIICCTWSGVGSHYVEHIVIETGFAFWDLTIITRGVSGQKFTRHNGGGLQNFLTTMPVFTKIMWQPVKTSIFFCKVMQMFRGSILYKVINIKSLTREERMHSIFPLLQKNWVFFIFPDFFIKELVDN